MEPLSVGNDPQHALLTGHAGLVLSRMGQELLNGQRFADQRRRLSPKPSNPTDWLMGCVFSPIDGWANSIPPDSHQHGITGQFPAMAYSARSAGEFQSESSPTSMFARVSA